MNVVYVPESFPQVSETFVINEIYGLIDKGFNISVVPRIPGADMNTPHARLQAILPLVDVVYEKGYFDIRGFFYGLRYGTQVWMGWRPRKFVLHINNALSISQHVAAIKRQNPKLVLIHFGYDNAIAGAIAAKLLNIPSILWMHGSDIHTVPHRSLHWLVKHTSRIVTNSHYSVGVLNKLGVDKSIEISYLGVNLDKFVPMNPSIKEVNPTIICVARLGHSKNHPLLLKLFDHITAKIPNVKLWLVGDGPNLKKYENLVSERNRKHIMFLGGVNQEQLIELLNRAWIKVLLSEKEGLGVAFIEAQAVGLPCVASNVGGIPEVIQDHDTGFLFDLDDTEVDMKVVGAIVDLLSNDDLRMAMGEKARVRAVEMFDENNHISRMENIINNLSGIDI